MSSETATAAPETSVIPSDFPISTSIDPVAACTTASYVYCGVDAGCIPEDRCCIPGIGLYCLASQACFTLENKPFCYPRTETIPTTTLQCYEYLQTGHDCSQESCFYCSDTALPYCSTSVFTGGGFTLSHMECGATSGIGTYDIGLPLPKRTVTATTTSLPRTTATTTSTFPRTSSQPTETDPPASDSSSLSGGAIAGIAIGAFAAVAIIAVLAFFLFRKRSNAAAAAPVPAPQQSYAPMGQSYPVSPTVPSYPGSPQPQSVYGEGWQGKPAYAPTPVQEGVPAGYAPGYAAPGYGAQELGAGGDGRRAELL